MSQFYLLQNQDKLFLSKHREWVDGRDLGGLYKTRHKDEALNQLVEVNTKDYSQRIHVLGCAIKPNGLPQIDPDHLPPPAAKPDTEAQPESTPADPPAHSEREQHQQPQLAVDEH